MNRNVVKTKTVNDRQTPYTGLIASQLSNLGWVSLNFPVDNVCKSFILLKLPLNPFACFWLRGGRLEEFRAGGGEVRA